MAVMKTIMDEDCEHGLSLALCAGPNHYPDDSMDDFPVTYSDAASQYHAQGMPCPFDCAACDPNNAIDDYDPAWDDGLVQVDADKWIKPEITSWEQLPGGDCDMSDLYPPF